MHGVFSAKELRSLPTYFRRASLLAFGVNMAENLQACPNSIGAGHPLSPMQELMLAESSGGSGINVTQVICSLPEAIDPSRMEAAWQQLLTRHEALRASFRWEKSGQQVFHENLSLPFSFHSANSENEVEQIIEQEFRKGFDPAVPPLLRVGLVRRNETDFRLIWTFHHLIADGRSIVLVLKDVFAIYEALRTSGKSKAELPATPYHKFLEWLQGQRNDTAEEFWRKQLKGFSTPTSLDAPAHSRTHSSSTNEESIVLDEVFTTCLREFARQNGGTLNTLVQGAWALLLNRYTGEEDVVFGAVRAGRHGTVPNAESLVGVFINTVPVRVRISPEQRLSAWLKELRESWVQLRAFEHTPLSRILACSEVTNGRRLFETLVNVQDPPWDAALKAQGGAWERRAFQIRNQPGLPLALDVYAERQIVLKLVYNRARFEPAGIQRMLVHLKALLDEMAQDAERSVSNIPLLTAGEEQLLDRWNQTEAEIPGAAVHQLFERVAARNPQRLAITSGKAELSYGQVNQRADELAWQLRERGVCPDSLVAIAMDRSIELIIAALAILKCGAAYVPIDPAYPQERVAQILKETAAPVLLMRKGDNRFASIGTPAISVDRAESVRDEREFRSVASGPLNLAYVIYTSGSTGVPKGVEIQHRGLSNLIHWHQSTYEIKAEDRATLLASPAFDAAVWEIWPYLSAGASIHIPDEETRLSPARLVRWLGENRITFCFMPTPLAEQALEESWPASSLKALLTGGDKLRRTPSKPLPFRLINHYGPTENSVVSTFAEVGAGMTSAPPIGKPIQNTRVYVLDRYLRRVPTEVAGELYISGAGLARGYLKQPQLTADRFIANPFEPGTRLYRTGDLVRFRADGNLEFIGRLDHQVKVRGYRIETGEVEACLNRHPSVKQCAVIPREHQGETRLIAYLAAKGDGEPPATELRNHLEKALPAYMVPTAFVWLEEFPLTTNGKIDRAALPAPAEEPDTATPARTTTELTIAEIWKELLAKDQIGATANFFELGGHSLMAARVISRLEAAFGIELSLTDLFDAPTISQLAERVDERQRFREVVRTGAIQPRSDTAPVLSFAQERLWFMERLQPGLPFNNIPLAVRIAGKLNRTALQQASNAIVRRHESLRTSFRSDKGRPLAQVNAASELEIPQIDLRALAPAEKETKIAELSREEAETPFNLEMAPLLRIKLLQLSEDEHVLLITTHHIVGDGWSLGIFFRELGALYQSICRGEGNPLPELPIRYGDFAAWQRESLQGANLEKQQNYWQTELKGTAATLEIPTDRARPAVQTYRGATLFFALPNALAAQLKTVAQHENVTLFMLLLSAFQTLLQRYSGQEEIVVGSPVAGRTRVETEGLIGLFLNNLAFRAMFPAELTFRDLLRANRERALGAYAHQDLPFERLVESLQLQRDLSRSPLFQAMFVLQNAPLQPLKLSGLSLTPIPLHSGTSKYDLTLGIEERADSLAGYVEYSTDLFSEATILRMLGHLQTLLEAIARTPDERTSRLPLLTAAEKKQLLQEWNNTLTGYPNRCVHELFSAQAERTPNATALAFEGRELSYAELNRQANRLAHHLQSLGVGPEVLAGVCLHRSIEMMIALLAIHKAGGAYVPLDPNYPSERLQFMLEDSGARVLVTEEALAGKLPFSPEKTVCVDKFLARSNEPEIETNPLTTVKPENVAYVIYTSGSTGKPKGVMVLHRNVANFFVGMDQQIGTTPGVWLAVTSISFDISVLELFWTLTRGFKVVIQSDGSSFRATNGSHKNGADTAASYSIAEQLIAHRVTHFQCTPALFSMLVEDSETLSALRGVSTIMLGGEAFPAPLAERLNGPRLLNMYGPTETTIWSTTHEVKEMAPVIPIGRPIANTEIYIVDRELQPVPVNVPGELLIGGAGVTRGYLNRAELTASRFIPNPFSANGNGMLYRTGDLARYLPDGRIECLGRTDHQVKLRGFRIELGEIEAALRLHPAVREAAVVAREVAANDKRLIGYITAKGEQKPSIPDLKRFLKEKLPDYMVPSAIVSLEKLPLTPNGKIDRKALPSPEIRRSEVENAFAPAQTNLEKSVARIWEQVLQVEQVGLNDNFFELGGHSLLAAQLHARLIETLGCEFPIIKLFQYPTVSALAKFLGQGQKEGNSLQKVQDRARRQREAFAWRNPTTKAAL